MVNSEFKIIDTTTDSMLQDLLVQKVMIKSINVFNEDLTNDATIKIGVNDPEGFILFYGVIQANTGINIPMNVVLDQTQYLVIEASKRLDIVVSYIEDKGVTLV